MRRFYIIVTAVVLALACCFCGCSCQSGYELPFTNAFYGKEGVPERGYTEHLEYAVELSENYSDVIVRDPSISRNVLDAKIYGTYTSTLEVTMSFDERSTLLNREFTSDFKKEIEKANVLIYKLYQKMELTCEYTIGGDKYYVDQVNQTLPVDTYESLTYFIPSSLSFAPVYSETKQQFNSVVLGESGVMFIEYDNECYTNYSINSYTQHVNYKKAIPEIDKTTKYEYARYCAIDNNQLLFAIRNVDITSQETYELPTISYQYGDPVSLKLSNSGSKEMEVSETDLTVNGAPFNGATLKVRTNEFNLVDVTKSGAKKICLVQESASGNLDNHALIYQYVEPLTLGGNYKTLGALVFTLKSVNY